MAHAEVIPSAVLQERPLQSRFSTDHFNSYTMLQRSLNYENNLRTRHTLDMVEKKRDAILQQDSGETILRESRTIIEQIRHRKKNTLEHEDIERALGAFSAAAKETIGLTPYRAQLRASLAQIEGGIHGERAIIEMNTGEGKTLVGAMTATTLALEGHPVHVATSNDVLAVRDMLEMGPVYHALGIQVGAILSTQGTNEIQYLYDPNSPNKVREASRAEVYNAPIVYGKASEFGFDYQRDNRELSPNRLRQQELGYCIVDEIDNILDESQTPLIIEGELSDSFAMAIRITRNDDQNVMTTVFNKNDIDSKKDTEVYTEPRLHRLFAAAFDHMREGIDYKLDVTGTNVELLSPEDETFSDHLNNIPSDQQKPPYGRARLESILRGQTLPGEERPVLHTPLLADDEGLYGPPPTVEDRSHEGPLLKAARNKVGITHRDADAIANQTIKAAKLNYYIQSAMQARLLYHDRYVLEQVKDPRTGEKIIDPSTQKDVWEIVPVDANTHRPTPGTRLMNGLAGAIEALERRNNPDKHIVIHAETSPAATITYPEFFSMYKRVTGMTATAIVLDPKVNIAKELCQTFNVDDIIHISSQFPEGERKDDPTRRLFENWEDKHEYIARRVVEMHKKPLRSDRDGSTQVVQPILIGAESEEEAERIALAIRNAIQQTGELTHFDMKKLQVLHAENTFAELGVIADAGRNGMITVTSMFGRGTDIRLGGDRKAQREGNYSWEDEHADVWQAGGLHIIANEDDPRKFRQFIGRGGRQQDPRSSERIASLDDRVIREGLTENELTAAQGVAKTTKSTWPEGNTDIPYIFDHPKIAAATTILTDAINGSTIKMAEQRQYINGLHLVDNAQRIAWYHDRMALLTGKGLEEQLYTMVQQHRDEFSQLQALSPRFSFSRLFGADKNLQEAIHQKVAGFGPQQKALLLKKIDNEWEAYLGALESIREGTGFQRNQNSSRPTESNRDLVEYFISASADSYEQLQQQVRTMVIEAIFGSPESNNS